MKNALGQYFDSIKEVPNLTREEEYELSKKIQAGDKESLDILIKRNLRLVINIATKYSRKNFPLEDLIAYGNLGLITAAQRYDYKKECKFSTSATIWIRQSIGRALADYSKLIRIPVHLSNEVGKYIKSKEELRIKIGQDPDKDQIKKNCNYTLKKINKYELLTIVPTSIDKDMGNSGEGCEGEFNLHLVTDTACFQNTEGSMLIDIKALMPKLDEISQNILNYRYGTNGFNKKTLDGVAKIMNLSRERVRQIESKAIKKLNRIVSKSPQARYLTEGEGYGKRKY